MWSDGAPDHLLHVGDQPVDVGRLGVERLAPREREQPVRERRRALRGTLCGDQVTVEITDAALGHADLQQLEAAGDAGQQVVEIMREPAGQLAEGLHLLALSQRGLGGFEGRVARADILFEQFGARGERVGIARRFEGVATQFQQPRRVPRQSRQAATFRRVERALLRVDHAHGAQRLTVRIDDRRAGVETDVRFAGDERVVLEAWILARILDHEHLVGRVDGLGAERDVAGCFLGRQPDACLEPLAVRVHQRDQGDRHPADLRGEHDQVVELVLRERVENLQAFQGGEPECFRGG